MTKKAMILLADGFEEVEALGTCDVLRRCGAEVVLAGADNREFVIGSHNITVKTDCGLAKVKAEDFDAVILPGGMPGSTNLRDNPAVISLVQSMAAAGKVTAAICAAPIVLDRAGLLNGVNFTGYPGLEELYGENKPDGKAAERDGNIVTGRGPGATFAFAALVAEALGMKAEAEKTLKGMLV